MSQHDAFRIMPAWVARNVLLTIVLLLWACAPVFTR